MSSRACPDWPALMELAPELTFRHYTLGEVHLPAEAFVQVEGIPFDAVAVCCDLDAHVFNPEHTDPRIVSALHGHALARRPRGRGPRRLTRSGSRRRLGSVRGRWRPPSFPSAAPIRSAGSTRSTRACARRWPRRCSPTSSTLRALSARCSSSRRSRRRFPPAAPSSPIRSAGRALPSAQGSPSPSSGRCRAPFLVVNADLPCVDRPRPAGARRRRPGARARPRRCCRRHDQRARALGRAPVRAGLRARQRRPLRAARRVARRSTRRTCTTTSTRWPIWRASRPASASTRGACCRCCTWARPHEGGCPLGRRRGRAVPARRSGCCRSRQRFHHRQRGGRPRGARPARLARPRQHPLHAHRARRRRAWLGPRRRDVAGARDRRAARAAKSWFSLGDRDLGLHLVRTQLLREGASLSEATERLAHALRPRGARCCRRPTIRCAPSSRRRPERSRSRRGSSAAAIATRSTPSTTPVRRTRHARPAWSRRSRPPTCCSSRRAIRTSRSGRSSRSRRSAARSSVEPCRASPSVR